MSQVVKTFFDVHMSISFEGMRRLIGSPLKHNECACFVNASWTAAKVLYPNGHMHYFRAPTGAITPDMLRQLPLWLPRKQLSFGHSMGAVLKEHASFLKEHRQFSAARRA